MHGRGWCGKDEGQPQAGRAGSREGIVPVGVVACLFQGVVDAFITFLLDSGV